MGNFVGALVGKSVGYSMTPRQSAKELEFTKQILTVTVGCCVTTVGISVGTTVGTEISAAVGIVVGLRESMIVDIIDGADVVSFFMFSCAVNSK